MNDRWLGIMTSQQSLGPKTHITRNHQMLFMASYNLDKLWGVPFWQPVFDHFGMSMDLRKGLREEDVALMKFGFDWLIFSLFGEKTLKMSQ